MLIRGQGEPSGIVFGSESLASVQGQPVLPGGGGGSSVMLGQRIVAPISLDTSAGNHLPSVAAQNAGGLHLPHEPASLPASRDPAISGRCGTPSPLRPPAVKESRSPHPLFAQESR